MSALKVTWHLFTSAPIWLAVSICAAEAADQPREPASADTLRILSNIDRQAPDRSAADKRAADRLNRDGERAYRKRDYRAARTAFSNSYPNFPTAFAYIMTGDSHWRAALQIAKARVGSSATASNESRACAMSNEHFSHDLLMDLDQHHDVGLALAAKVNGGTLPKEPLIQRAHAEAVCLRSLGTRYESQPATACVDMDSLAACLGVPLL
ncbi:hypothetical protein [Ideonella sp.]|uniref:hypothetical protein n=1 Tax=Ideonella sp. TaxID=1929293 RepID=UPI0035B1E7E7